MEKLGGIFGVGKSNDAFAKYFTRESYLNNLTKENDWMQISNVSFSKSCYNNFHIHFSKYPVGQILIRVSGLGVYKEEGKDAIIMHPGDVIEVPSGVKHFHGAAPGHTFSHLAFSIPDETAYTKWYEALSKEEYNNIKIK